MAMVVIGILLALAGFLLTMLMMPYALVLSVAGIALAIAGRRTANRIETH